MWNWFKCNHLYFEKCHINYIEFSSNSNPCFSKEKNKVQTIQIDCSTYLYYDILYIMILNYYIFD